MSREWKPGDVAMVTGRWIRTEEHSERYAVRRGEGWISRGRLALHVSDWEVSAVRPLVVLDPEDAEQVARLADVWDRWQDRVPYADMREEGDLTYTTAAQSALREFANPTPPKRC